MVKGNGDLEILIRYQRGIHSSGEVKSKIKNTIELAGGRKGFLLVKNYDYLQLLGIVENKNKN